MSNSGERIATLLARLESVAGQLERGTEGLPALTTKVEALIDGMQRYRPTIFISVPRKWIQLHESIVKRADPMHASDEEVREATHDLTGGRLRWGLSAAGHLDPEIFRFFHGQGVQLLSGYGMSEGRPDEARTWEERAEELAGLFA